MQRFYLPAIKLTSDTVFSINKDAQTELWHQLKNVLRAKVGDLYIFFGEDTNDFIVQLKNIESESFQFVVQAHQEVQTELDFELILIQALPQKSEKWEWILQKGTELGVTKFIPLISERTQRSILPKAERMQRIILEAVEQSGRTKIPQIASPMFLKDLIRLKNTKMLFASLHSDKNLISQLSSFSSSSLSFIIGPEGGFTANEEDYLQSLEAIPFSLGMRVLRMETAAIVSVAIAALQTETLRLQKLK